MYSSKDFGYTLQNPNLPPDMVKGGTGYVLFAKLPNAIDNMFLDNSIYPDCDYVIGYIKRGCPDNCRWCIVPKKEGKIYPYRDWRNVVRPDSDKLVLMNNKMVRKPLRTLSRK